MASYAFHTTYEVEEPPEFLSDTSIRFVCISDTHSETFPVPDGDVLIHAGDLTALGTFAEIKATMDWICSLPHEVKIIVAGNHDIPLDPARYKENWSQLRAEPFEDPQKSIDLFSSERAKNAGVISLENSSTTITVRDRRFKVFGSPISWTKRLNAAFTYTSEEEVKGLIDGVPLDTDILITHTPPHSIYDYFRHPETGVVHHLGNKLLWNRLKFLQPKMHVFGHIHENHGILVHRWETTNTNPSGEEPRKTLFVNASSEPTGYGIKAMIEAKPALKGIKLRTGHFPFQPIIVDLE